MKSRRSGTKLSHHGVDVQTDRLNSHRFLNSSISLSLFPSFVNHGISDKCGSDSVEQFMLILLVAMLIVVENW